MLPKTLILYDLVAKDPCTCWSPNVWKTRLALNFKGVSYETEWIELSDVAEKFRSFGIVPNQEGTPYTVPAIRLASDKYVMDSTAIAQQLEHMRPSPPLHLDSPMIEKVQLATGDTLAALSPLLVSKVYQRTLSSPSAACYAEKHSKLFGTSLEAFATGEQAKNAWQNAEPSLEDLKALLSIQKGPYFLGHNPSYADFILVAFLAAINRIDQIVLGEMYARAPTFEILFRVCEKWLQRDDH